MTSRERMYATLDFRGPDRLPTDFWPLPSLWFGREEAVNAVLARYPVDIGGIPFRDVFQIDCYRAGRSVDICAAVS